MYFEASNAEDKGGQTLVKERGCFIDNLLVRIHLIIVIIRWTGLAPWEFEFPFPGSLISTFLKHACSAPVTPHFVSEMYVICWCILRLSTLKIRLDMLF